MDKDLFYISLAMLIIGIGGQLAWYFFGHVPCNPSGGNPYLFGSPCDPAATTASFQEMENISGYMMLIGFILLPAGLFKDGLPAPGYTAKVFIGFILILLVGVGFTGLILLPSGSSPQPTNANGFISILSGSATPGTAITFSPQNVTVIIGQNNTIQWTNNDASIHTVTSTSIPAGAAPWNQFLNPGQKFVYTFNVTGKYQYVCTIHSWMRGTITVKNGP